MSDSNRLGQLFGALEKEINAARAGSDQGQFPILDLLGNVRDEAALRPETEALRVICAKAWERVVAIVESGKAFQAEEIQWLNDLLAQFSVFTQGGSLPVQKAEPQAPASNPAPVSPPAAEPAAGPVVAPAVVPVAAPVAAPAAAPAAVPATVPG